MDVEGQFCFYEKAKLKNIEKIHLDVAAEHKAGDD